MSYFLMSSTGSGLKHSTSLQLTRLAEKVFRNFGKKRITGIVSLDVAKASDTIWFEGPFHKLAVLNFPSYFVKAITSHLSAQTVEGSFQMGTSASRDMRAGVKKGRLISPDLYNRYVKDMPIPSRHVEIAFYADGTAVTATTRKPKLLVSYLEYYLRDLEWWLREWRIGFNAPKSIAKPTHQSANWERGLALKQVVVPLSV